ncbi:hypothetical protein GLYMA_05G214800v4 [Glycine max]|uniref:Uncharacterized protein n=2 Tax=Glycine subgen. Soja TaxID=1462606 RepID=K7KRY9_SOYBN|nr:hypothetical protein JHK87_013536 [Glycine soja]KAG5041512.1 hypothetical protein JHK85_013988 [Glycine max]KAH1135628.1 hypothetical protein GYH30_013386 [Glycine max]KHM99921.1 hypothetical protein glysoja_017619 [Glycine soja]KRH60013.1 hypothetical protein GLYMA_05G214800v4 [Glycine max]
MECMTCYSVLYVFLPNYEYNFQHSNGWTSVCSRTLIVMGEDKNIPSLVDDMPFFSTDV